MDGKEVELMPAAKELYISSLKHQEVTDELRLR